MVEWHHQLNGHEFEHTLEDGEGQGRLVYCSPWDCKEADMTQQLNNYERDLHFLKTEIVTFSMVVDFLLSHSSLLRKIGWTKNLIIIESFLLVTNVFIFFFFNQQAQWKSLCTRIMAEILSSPQWSSQAGLNRAGLSVLSQPVLWDVLVSLEGTHLQEDVPLKEVQACS